MISIPFWLTCTIFIVAAIFFVVIICYSDDIPKRRESPSVSIAGESSIITVSKVGRSTSVIIRTDVHDHWEGSDGVSIPETPIEITRKCEPELYAEYMSKETTATRKYEIADQLYSIGYTLPYIKGLNEQWRREQNPEPIDMGDIVVIPTE